MAVSQCVESGSISEEFPCNSHKCSTTTVASLAALLIVRHRACGEDVEHQAPRLPFQEFTGKHPRVIGWMWAGTWGGEWCGSHCLVFRGEKIYKIKLHKTYGHNLSCAACAHLLVFTMCKWQNLLGKLKIYFRENDWEPRSSVEVSQKHRLVFIWF